MSPSYSIAIGAESSGLLKLGLPVLAGPTSENLFPGAVSAGRRGLLQLGEWRGWLIGGAVVPISGNLETATDELYTEIFSGLGDLRLARCWNFVPDINEMGEAGLENYRVFCRGRSIAFERCFGTDFAVALPAASAVGGRRGALSVFFAASPRDVTHVENPLQVPAYEYPRQYGPRAPSFARATVARTATEHRVFVSGTAAIRGHLTVAPDRTDEQLACTLENLVEVSKLCGLGPDLARDGGAQRHFKVYLRHSHEYAQVAKRLDASLFEPHDTVSYVRADICRRDLNVEIEATIIVR